MLSRSLCRLLHSASSLRTFSNAVGATTRAFASQGGEAAAAAAAEASSSSSSTDSARHFNVRAFYLGSDVDVQAAAEKLSPRCLSCGKDFAVFSLGPEHALLPGPARVLPPLHVMHYGVMIAFRFGSVVFFQPDSAPVLPLPLEALTLAAADPTPDLTPGGHPGPAAVPLWPLGAPAAVQPGGEGAPLVEEGGSGGGGGGGGGGYDVEEMAQLQKELKRVIRTVVTDPVKAMPRSEEASIMLRPRMKLVFAKEVDRMAIRELDLGTLEVICRVIGQSAALDFYTSKVGDSLRDFDKVLADLAVNAGKPFFQRPLLFRRLRGGRLLSTIAGSSLMYNKVVSKLGLLDTSRTAWESDVHDLVWKGLKKEYELEQRFENLLKKLDIYKEESRFILDVRNERGSAAAEKVIIILIALEIIVNAAFHILH